MTNKGYSYSDSLHGMLQDTTPESFKYIHGMIDMHIEQYASFRKEHTTNVAAYSYQKNTQDIIDKDVVDSPDIPTCRAGCSFCCMTQAVVTEDEPKLLATCVKEDKIEIDMDKLKRQAEDRKAGVELRDKPCIMLDDKGMCRVYEYRPINCRKLLVITEPELCDHEKYPNGEVGRLVITEPEAISTALMTSIPSGNMSEMLYKELNPNQDGK